MNAKTIGYIILEGNDISRPESTKIVRKDDRRVEAIGIMQTADVKNRNGRIYEESELFPQLVCPRQKELLETGNMKGEDGHPQETNISRQSVIDPLKVCVKYLEFWTEGKDVWARYKGTNNALGEAFNQDLLDGEKPSFSLRALGCIENKNGNACVKGLRMITYDRVIFPSHIAYTKGIVETGTRNLLKEGVEYEQNDSGIYLSKEQKRLNENGLVLPITNDDTISFIKSESSNIKTIMENFDVLYESMTLVNNSRDVQLVDKTGNVIIVSLESRISDEIMNYCSKF